MTVVATQEIEAMIAVIDCPHHQPGQMNSAHRRLRERLIICRLVIIQPVTADEPVMYTNRLITTADHRQLQLSPVLRQQCELLQELGASGQAKKSSRLLLLS